MLSPKYCEIRTVARRATLESRADGVARDNVELAKQASGTERGDERSEE